MALLHLEEAVLWPSVQQFPQSPPTAASPDSGPQARKRRGIRERRRVLVALQNGHSQFILFYQGRIARWGKYGKCTKEELRINKGPLQLARLPDQILSRHPISARSVHNLGQKPCTNLHGLS